MNNQSSESQNDTIGKSPTVYRFYREGKETELLSPKYHSVLIIKMLCILGAIVWEATLGMIFLLFINIHVNFDYRHYGVSVEHGG